MSWGCHDENHWDLNGFEWDNWIIKWGRFSENQWDLNGFDISARKLMKDMKVGSQKSTNLGPGSWSWDLGRWNPQM